MKVSGHEKITKGTLNGRTRKSIHFTGSCSCFCFRVDTQKKTIAYAIPAGGTMAVFTGMTENPHTLLQQCYRRDMRALKSFNTERF